MDIAVKKLQDEIARLREEIEQFTCKHGSTIAFQERYRELCGEQLPCSECPRCNERKLVDQLNQLLDEMQTRMAVLDGHKKKRAE